MTIDIKQHKNIAENLFNRNKELLIQVHKAIDKCLVSVQYYKAVFVFEEDAKLFNLLFDFDILKTNDISYIFFDISYIEDVLIKLKENNFRIALLSGDFNQINLN